MLERTPTIGNTDSRSKSATDDDNLSGSISIRIGTFSRINLKQDTYAAALKNRANLRDIRMKSVEPQL